MVEEIHKGCGGQIIHIQKLTYPPIPCRRCNKCGKEDCDEPEKIDRKEVPLGDDEQ